MGYHYFPSSYSTPTPIPETRGWIANNILWCEDFGISVGSTAYYHIYSHNNYAGNPLYLFQNNIDIIADATECYWGEMTTQEMDSENTWPTAGSEISSIYDIYENFDLGFVDYGYWRSEPNPDAPGFLWLLDLTPPSPVGAETVTFTLTFSREMDTGFEPVVTFGQTDPYDTHTITGGWEPDNQTWIGTFEIDTFTGDGEHTIRVTDAMDPDGMQIPEDTHHTFIIETGIGIVEGVAAIAQDTSIDISWQANYEPDLMGYRVYYGLAPGDYNGSGAAEGPSPIDVSNVNAFSLTDLTPGEWVYMAVQAYDTGFNDGPLSAEVAAIPGGAGPTPTPICLHHGDVNFSGDITAGDAQMAFYIAVGIYTPSVVEECAADCNNDGSVTAGDAQIIFGLIFGGPGCWDSL